MRVFMLGWEFPPFITGGLGTACHGLTRALDARGVGVTFVMPGATAPSAAAHVDLLSPESLATKTSPPITTKQTEHEAEDEASPDLTDRAASEPHTHSAEDIDSSPNPHEEQMEFIHLPVRLLHPYSSEASSIPVGRVGMQRLVSEPEQHASQSHSAESPDDTPSPEGDPDVQEADPPPSGTSDYGGDMFAEVRRFAKFARLAATGRTFDVIHAHDWMTYPAGLEVARRTGRPLIVHVHSTEFDRSGEQVNQQIYDIERRGMHGAMRVITVSRLTRNIVIHRYGVAPDKVTVVYNGVAIDPIERGVQPIGRREKIVLYFGRITRQKGPEYFLSLIHI